MKKFTNKKGRYGNYLPPDCAARRYAAMMTSSPAEPPHPKTRYMPRVAFGATPVNVGALAPMIPLTCVPCPLQSSGYSPGTGKL